MRHRKNCPQVSNSKYFLVDQNMAPRAGWIIVWIGSQRNGMVKRQMSELAFRAMQNEFFRSQWRKHSIKQLFVASDDLAVH